MPPDFKITLLETYFQASNKIKASSDFIFFFNVGL